MIKYPFILIHSKVKIVHICGVSYFSFWENSWYVSIAKLFGRKVTLHYLGAFDQFYNGVGCLQRSLIRTTLKIPDRLIFLSEKVRILVSSFIQDEKLSVIPSSVDTDKFNVPKRSFPVQEGEVRILFIGGLDPFRKGVYDLLSALERIINKIPEIKLIMTGGDSFKEVKEVWHTKNLDQHILFYGWIDEEKLPSLYASADILALPSYNEGLPYVVIEALSSGLPVVGSNVGGIAEVIEDGNNGFTIDSGDIDALESRLMLLLENAALREQISVKNRIKAVKYYSIDSVLNKLDTIFHKLISE